MITEAEFLLIQLEVIDAVKECFDIARKNEKRVNEFVCFLANADYHDDVPPWWSPYSIDNEMDKIKDDDRLDFFMEFVNHRYVFDKTKSTDDDKKMVSIELMIYTHIWESKPFLKMIRRLAGLCSANEFEWKVEVPDFTKQDFIRKGIRDQFAKANLKIAKVMTNGFHSSLRNAFAHSEYSFQITPGVIYLFNYKGEAHELQEISYNDWTTRFCYSFLLNYHVYDTFNEMRSKINDLYGVNEYIIPQPEVNGGYRQVTITYRPDLDYFQFKDGRKS